MKRPSQFGFYLALFLALSGVGGISASAANEAPGLPPALQALGWEEITFDGKHPNRYAPCGEHCIEVITDSSVSMIGKPVTVDLAQTAIIRWEWKIANRVGATDLATKGRDDRAAAVYVTFPYDPDTASFKDRLLRPFIEVFRGKDTPGRVLSYVWGGVGTIGNIIESPFYGGINAMIVSRNEQAPTGTWIRERFDIIADHKRAFGTTPTTVSNILLSADSDDTQAANRASIRHIRFTSN